MIENDKGFICKTEVRGSSGCVSFPEPVGGYPPKKKTPLKTRLRKRIFRKVFGIILKTLHKISSEDLEYEAADYPNYDDW